jgi:hypothetical protein
VVDDRRIAEDTLYLHIGSVCKTASGVLCLRQTGRCSLPASAAHTHERKRSAQSLALLCLTRTSKSFGSAIDYNVCAELTYVLVLTAASQCETPLTRATIGSSDIYQIASKPTLALACYKASQCKLLDF